MLGTGTIILCINKKNFHLQKDNDSYLILFIVASIFSLSLLIIFIWTIYKIFIKKRINLYDKNNTELSLEKEFIDFSKLNEIKV